MEKESQYTGIRLKRKTKIKLEPYKKEYGSYEKGILFLINAFEN